MSRTCQWAVDQGSAQTTCWGWNACRQGRCEAKEQAARKRKAEKASYRKFPGRPPLFPGLKRPPGSCSWCEGSIMDPAKPGQVNKRRGWHDGRNGEPNCLGEYYAHTRGAEALSWILWRDGPACAGCGEVVGGWVQRSPSNPDKIRGWGPSWARRYPPAVYVGQFTLLDWRSGLQADHRLALGLVVLTIPEAERWAYWGPMNLQGLCHPCHVAKTREDVVKIKAARLTAPAS